MNEKTVFNVTVCVLGTIVLLLHIVQTLLKRNRRKDENALLLFYCFTAFHFLFYAITAIIRLYCTSDPFIISIYTIFFLMNNLEVFLFYHYFFNYVDIPSRPRKIAFYLNLVLFLCFAFSDIANIFARFYFTSENGQYARGDFMFLSQGYQFFAFALILLLTFANKKLLRREKAAFSIYVLLPFASIIAQDLLPGYAIAYAALFVAVEILTFFLMQEKNIRIKEEERQLEQAKTQMLMSQIRPHFIYNILSSISTLISVDAEKAQKALDDFSEYLRINFSSLATTRLISFEEELAHIKTYVELETMRFEERLNVVYDIQSKDFSLPPLSIQPLVENAVKHGVLKRLEGGTIAIRTYEDRLYHVVEIEDDGVGFDANAVFSDDHVGISNVRRRLELSRLGEVYIESRIGVGSKVTVRFFKARA